MRLKRFTVGQRIFHLLLVAAFLIQSATGLSRMYVETPFGRTLAAVFGGGDASLAWHKTVGLLMLLLFAAHLLYLLVRIRPGTIAGPDSMLPRISDIRQFARHTLWIIGLGNPPEFERWTYWEKFDYWAVFWGMIIIGTTGLLLYDPVYSSTFMAGWGLNVALWVHRIEALLAMGHIFIIHFAVAHLRRSHFPVDRAMFTGGMDLSLARKERGEWVRRLEEEGRLAEMTMKRESRPRRIAVQIAGVALMLCGGVLAVLAITNAPFITW